MLFFDIMYKNLQLFKF